MGRLKKLLSRAKDHFDDGEVALAAVVGQYETKRLGAESLKTGIMIATDRRVLFYAKRMFGYQLEHFPYRCISSFEEGKRMMGYYIRFFASGNEVSLKWIAKGDIEVFAGTVRMGMAEGTATRVAPKRGVLPKPPKWWAHWPAYAAGLFLVSGCVGLIAWLFGNQAATHQRSRQSETSRISDPVVPRSQRTSATRPHAANPFAPAETLRYDESRAAEGQALYERIVAEKPELYRFYEEDSLAPLTDEYTVLRTDGWRYGVDVRGIPKGFAAIIFLPEDLWNGLSDSERESLGHFLTRESPDSGWVVYVGEVKRIDSRDEIMGDRTPMSSREWDWTPTP